VVKTEDIVEEIVRRFIAGTETCHTVDCVLVRLSSAFLEIGDFVKEFPTTAREEELITCFLNHPDVLRILAGLASSIEALVEKITLDPRFKNLRPYTTQILHAVELASTEYPPRHYYSAVEKPPLWRIENLEHELREVKSGKAFSTTALREIEEEPSTGYYPVKVTSTHSRLKNPLSRITGYTRIPRRRGIPLSALISSKTCIALYIIMLLINAYTFTGLPWIVIHGEQHYISITEGTKITPVSVYVTGWDITQFYIELWRLINIRPPLFIAYFIGLLLAVIALVMRSPTLSAISGLAMLVGWYDLYTSASTNYAELKVLAGLIYIKSVELLIGAMLAGILAIFQLVAGTILIHKVSR